MPQDINPQDINPQDINPQDIRLASIHIYPVKAARAVDLGESRVEPQGLAGDRRWLLVDTSGRFVSQREEPALARVTVTGGNDNGNERQRHDQRGIGRIPRLPGRRPRHPCGAAAGERVG